MARKVLLGLALAFAFGGAAAPSAFADPTTAIDFAAPIVNANVGDIPGPNGEGIFNNIGSLPDAAFNSTTRNPICSLYTGSAP